MLAADKLVRNEAYEELAYLAGFFDGEGSISLGKRTKRGGFCLTVYLTNAIDVPLLAAQRVFGGRIAQRLPSVKHRRRLISNVLSLNGDAAARFLHAIYPWLTVKRTQADAALMFAETFHGCWKREKKYPRTRMLAPTDEANQLRRLAVRAFRAAIDAQGGRGVSWSA